MSEQARKKWNGIHARATSPVVPQTWLQIWLPALERGRRALDVACGRGGISIFLAKRGYLVDAFDISSVALASLQQRIDADELSIRCRSFDLDSEPLPQHLYALIHCSHYLDYDLMSVLKERLQPGGRLITEHYGMENLARHKRPSERYLVRSERMHHALSGLQLLFEFEGWAESHYVHRFVWERVA